MTTPCRTAVGSSAVLGSCRGRGFSPGFTARVTATTTPTRLSSPRLIDAFNAMLRQLAARRGIRARPLRGPPWHAVERRRVQARLGERAASHRARVQGRRAQDCRRDLGGGTRQGIHMARDQLNVPLKKSLPSCGRVSAPESPGQRTRVDRWKASGADHVEGAATGVVAPVSAGSTDTELGAREKGGQSPALHIRRRQKERHLSGQEQARAAVIERPLALVERADIARRRTADGSSDLVATRRTTSCARARRSRRSPSAASVRACWSRPTSSRRPATACKSNGGSRITSGSCSASAWWTPTRRERLSRAMTCIAERK